VAAPEWYRTDVGPVLEFRGAHHVRVDSVDQGWVVTLDSERSHVLGFAELLDRLAEVGARVSPTFTQDAEDGDPKVTTALDVGFAADLMWWCPFMVSPSINGVLCDSWADGPVPDLYDEGWELVDKLHWELEEGYSMTGNYGTMSVYRIGARYVGRDGFGDDEVGAYSGPDVARDFFLDHISPDLWERYGLFDWDEVRRDDS
jgi:hypothetical protein